MQPASRRQVGLFRWSRLIQLRALRGARREDRNCLLALIVVVGLTEFVIGTNELTAISYVAFVGLVVGFFGIRMGLAAAVLSSVLALILDGPVEGSGGVSSGWAGFELGVATGTGLLVGVACYWITERRLLREISLRTRQLQEESVRRQRLEAEILQVAGQEQGMLAQQIHDELGQYVSALSYHAKMLGEDLRDAQSVHAKKADRIAALIRSTNEAIRGLGRGVYDPKASCDEFDGALRKLAARFERLTGVRCAMRSTVGPLVLPRFQALMLFRIVQEACSNAVKHGNPKSIIILLSMRTSALHVEVDDDGCGLTEDFWGHAGLGLQMMQRRAELIGATLELRSAVVGCTLACDVPLSGLNLSPA